jgi:hypothetical protein
MIVESEAEKAEDIFWSNLFGRTAHKYKLYFSGGATSAEAETRHLCKDIRTGDIVILGLDKYTWSDYNKCYRLLQEKRKRLVFTLVVLATRSFEGMFLSYARLPSFARFTNQELKTVLLEAAALLRKRERLYPKMKDYDRKLRAVKLTPNTKTEEQFVYWLLQQVTLKPQSIQIAKGAIGGCWLIGCCDAHINTKNACPLRGNLVLSFKDKIHDMEANSIMVYNGHKLSSLIVF